MFKWDEAVRFIYTGRLVSLDVLVYFQKRPVCYISCRLFRFSQVIPGFSPSVWWPDFTKFPALIRRKLNLFVIVLYWSPNLQLATREVQSISINVKLRSTFFRSSSTNKKTGIIRHSCLAFHFARREQHRETSHFKTNI